MTPRRPAGEREHEPEHGDCFGECDPGGEPRGVGSGPSRRSRAPTLPAVKAFRRVLVALGIAGLIGAVAKLRGKGGVPPTSGGWRELEAPEFR